MAHERTHVRQQTAYGVEAWWNKYFESAEFRRSQELEAYRNEARWIRENTSCRNKRFKLIQQVARDLSSAIYGNVITYGEAMSKLQ
ncbi:MAG TPA: hypothetical protein ENI08_02275 [Candidatus Dependentiae bacterium]|nr:hypothetical protein [Candidatus Dependentiae bacterium]